MKLFRLTSLAALTLIVSLVPAPTAGAAFAGKNGLIVFERFYQETNGSTFLWTMRLDGSGQRRLGIGEHPRWSPDGDRIAFQRRLDDATYVFVVNADGSGKRRVARGFNPTWSPDGTRLSFNGEGGIVVRGLGQTAPSHVVAADGYYPDWGVNNRIAYVCLGSDFAANICTVHPNGSARRQLTHSGEDRYPRWSPDGRRIAFASSRDVYCCSFDLLYLIDADGSNERRLSRGLWDDDEDTYPSWSPDGTMLLFSTSRGYAGGSGHDLATMNPETGYGVRDRTRTDIAAEYASDWQPQP